MIHAPFVASVRALSLVIVLALTAACGPQPGGSAPPAQRSEASFVEQDNFELHYNAVRADQIPAEVARAHGIDRAKNRVMLNVTLLRKSAAGQPRKPMKAAVSVDAYNLNGQLKNMEMRQVTEGEAIYYIGTVGITGNEILVFDVKAQPEGESLTLAAKFTREFFTD